MSWIDDQMMTKQKISTSLKIAIAGIFTALVFVVSSQIPPIPIPATSGYFNVGETTIYVAALLFGPIVGAFAGGMGTALSDLYLGYSIYAPGTLLIKTAEGAVVGLLNIKLTKTISNTSVRATVSVVIGGLVMVLGYFMYQNLLATLFPGLGIIALAEIPINILQMVTGLIIAIPVTHAVLRVFPQLKSQI
jgi:uncharacterized membrane protein